MGFGNKSPCNPIYWRVMAKKAIDTVIALVAFKEHSINPGGNQ